ncbi:MAG: prephenate dehydratase [Ignavibacteriales bacterium]|nr:MAG: prephenate dehydratase [Ignavibacteriales bacterium]
MKDNLTVAFQGERGAFSEIAAEKFFNKKIITSPVYSFEEVFGNVNKELSDYGIIPVENTLYRSVFENYDLLLKYKVYVVGELNLQIHHCLISQEKYSLKEIKKVYSHYQALGQCSRFLESLENIEVVPTYDTAGSVLIVKQNNDEPSAAIASSYAAKIYKMKILAKNIQNKKINYTRFFIISRKKFEPPLINPKSTLSFDLKSVPGALHKALGVFANAGINLSMIESRPIPEKPFQYTFYVDISGDVEDENIKQALKELSNLTITIKKIGTYETGKTYQS